MTSSEKPVSAAGSALVSAAALAAFLLIFIEAGNFGTGARLFPRLLGVVGGLSAAVVLAQSCLRALAERRRRDPRAGAGAFSWHDVVISYVGPPIYALMLYALGFWIASMVCLSGLLLLLGERRPLMVATITAGTLLAVYLMFEFSFGIRMPAGLLFRD